MAINFFNHCNLTYRDNTGNTSRVGFWVGLDTAVGAVSDVHDIEFAVQTAMNACSNAQNVGSTGALLNAMDPSLYGAAAQYNNVEDKARLTFLSNSRLRKTTIQIPAPKLALFFSAGGGTGGDEETINPASTQIAALLAAMVLVQNTATVVVGPFADPVHSLVLGKLIRRKAHRKIGLWTKDPTGTIPA